jgi:hypothetical protein
MSDAACICAFDPLMAALVFSLRGRSAAITVFDTPVVAAALEAAIDFAGRHVLPDGVRG